MTMRKNMQRRRFLGTLAAGAAAAAVDGPLQAGPRTDDRPNILWISCEDMSPDMGCYGVDVHTPALDQLAADGVRFTRCFGHAGVCAPQRSGIITCMYPTTIGSNNMRTSGMGYECVPPPDVKCFTEYLRAAGYYCTNRSKTDYQFHPPLTAWDRQLNFKDESDWRGRAPGQPFFSVINFTITHESQIRTPKGRKARFPLDRVKLPPYYPDTPLVRNDYARYLENIEAMDIEAKKVLDRLEEDGLADNTIVWFWGDHGRGLPRGKRWLYDSGILAPLIIRWPGKLKPATVNDDLVAFIDFGATVLSMAGIPAPSHFQGQAFLGKFKVKPRTYVYGARDRMDEVYDLIRYVRDKRYKYLRNYQPEKPYAQHLAYMDLMPTMQELRRLDAEGKLQGAEKVFMQKSKPVEELYDCDNDPHEIHNLADSAEHQHILQRLRQAHEQWVQETGDLGFMPEAELINRMWPGGIQPVTLNPDIHPYGGRFPMPVQVSLECRTEGASIAYTMESGENPLWKLYTTPLTIDKSATLRVRANRIGFQDSAEVVARFTVG